MKINVNLKITALTMLLAVATIPVIAQPGGGRGQRTQEDVQEQITTLAKSLECSEDQEKQLMKFEMDQYTSSQADREQMRGDREAMREYMNKQNELRTKKYGEILSEEQMKKYNQMMEERRQQRQGGGGRPAGTETQSSRGRGGN